MSGKCIVSEISGTAAAPANAAAVTPTLPRLAISTLGVAFQINSTKSYVLVVTLSIKDSIKFLEKIWQGFKRKFSWNQYIFEIIIQLVNNKLDYIIDPIFRKVGNRLFDLCWRFFIEIFLW